MWQTHQIRIHKMCEVRSLLGKNLSKVLEIHLMYGCQCSVENQSANQFLTYCVAGLLGALRLIACVMFDFLEQIKLLFRAFSFLLPGL